MRKATSILSRYKSLVITFKHFSDSDFEFDLCYDFSFWKAETGRCIPKKLNDKSRHYSFPPICNRSEFDCNKVDRHLTKYCPNKDESCIEEQHFFCNGSKTCIPNGNNLTYIFTDRST